MLTDSCSTAGRRYLCYHRSWQRSFEYCEFPPSPVLLHFTQCMRVPPHSAPLPKALYAALLSLFTSLTEGSWVSPTQRYGIALITFLEWSDLGFIFGPMYQGVLIPVSEDIARFDLRTEIHWVLIVEKDVRDNISASFPSSHILELPLCRLCFRRFVGYVSLVIRHSQVLDLSLRCAVHRLRSP